VKKKIIISRDVVFEEKKGWEWNKSDTKKNSEITVDEIEEETNEPVTIQTNKNDGDEVHPIIVQTNNNDGNDGQINGGSDSDMSEPINSIQTSSDSDNEVEIQATLAPRNRRPPASFNDYVSGSELDDGDLHNLAIYTPADDPKTYAEVEKLDVWKIAMDQEIESIKNNDTWQLTTLPKGPNAIGVKWIYKTKYNEKGEIEKHKAKLVAK
ncbi:retrovirus-related Pol polyprotein from transposon TNT 1-94, partial [Trifolium pratense]